MALILPPNGLHGLEVNIKRALSSINCYRILKDWNNQGLITKQVTVVSSSSSGNNKVATTFKSVLERMLTTHVKAGDIASHNIHKSNNSVGASIYLNNMSSYGMWDAATRVTGYLNGHFTPWHLMNKKISSLGFSYSNNTTHSVVSFTTEFGSNLTDMNIAEAYKAIPSVTRDRLNTLLSKDDSGVLEIKKLYDRYYNAADIEFDATEISDAIYSIKYYLTNRHYTPTTGFANWPNIISSITTATAFITTNENINRSALPPLSLDMRFLTFFSLLQVGMVCRFMNIPMTQVQSMLEGIWQHDPITRTWNGQSPERILSQEQYNSSCSKAVLNYCYKLYLESLPEAIRPQDITLNSFVKSFVKTLYSIYMYNKKIFADNNIEFVLVIPEFENLNRELVE